MKKAIYTLISIIISVIAILLLFIFFSPLLEPLSTPMYYLVFISVGLLVLVACLLLMPKVGKLLENLTEKISSAVSTLSLAEFFSCAMGLICGLIIATLIGVALANIRVIGPYLCLLAVLILGYAGAVVGYRKRDEFATLFRNGEKASLAEKRENRSRNRITVKVLDTSVIIDGRIAEIYRTGFLEGDLVVPNFVLEELRHIADSSDTLKRARGRAGLDRLNAMREEFGNRLLISKKDYPEESEVDMKLLRLASDLHGVVVTNDFNLNKVAQFQGVQVLNINALSNAVKPVVLPGEEMEALVVKEGKEANQGVAYLDDGTMIVVENGRRIIGKRIHVIVTSILQTAAGRMI
ncbi:MAG: PIN domain-containing protein, partial [Bacillota bacterium]|nr:PIN domain-containing protein [Bacillota bacterium]